MDHQVDHPVQEDQDTPVEGEAMEDLPVEAMVVVMVVKVGDPLEDVRQFLGNNAGQFRNSNVEMFLLRSAALLISNNVEVSQSRNAQMFQNSNAEMCPNKSVKTYQSNNVAMFQNKNVEMFQSSNVQSNATIYSGAKFVTTTCDLII